MATTGMPTPVAMCMTPVSPQMSAAARLSTAPVSCRLKSPAALATWVPPRAAISAPIAESPGPPRATTSAPVFALGWPAVDLVVQVAGRLEVSLGDRHVLVVAVVLEPDEQLARDTAVGEAVP